MLIVELADLNYRSISSSKWLLIWTFVIFAAHQATEAIIVRAEDVSITTSKPMLMLVKKSNKTHDDIISDTRIRRLIPYMSYYHHVANDYFPQEYLQTVIFSDFYWWVCKLTIFIAATKCYAEEEAGFANPKHRFSLWRNKIISPAPSASSTSWVYLQSSRTI